MALNNLIVLTKKLSNMARWATDFMHQRPTVAEHSFSVAQICQMLGIIETKYGKEQIDFGKLLSKAINHDVTEGITGDIIHPTKHYNKEVTQAFDLIEKEMTEKCLLESIEEPFQSIYRDLLFDGKDDSIEGQILNDADNIDALLECMNEIRLGNFIPFSQKYQYIMIALRKSSLVSTKYFLTKILPELKKADSLGA